MSENRHRARWEAEWVGTPQHAGAADVSRYLVHMTSSEQNLVSILQEGVIEARNAFGIGRPLGAVAGRDNVVCLTEMPIPELRRMHARGRRWGLVFDKERLRKKRGAQPVWYVADPSPQMGALRSMAAEGATNPTHEIWKIAPFVQPVREFDSGQPNDWRWEREWRVLGDLHFEIEDVAAIVTYDAGRIGVIKEISVGVPWYSPDGVLEWVDGPVASWDAAMEGMLARFHSTFMPPWDAALPIDDETGRYWPVVEILELPDAMDETYGRLSDAVREALHGALERVSWEWCRSYDVDHAWE